jgi:hypothetical protein
MKMEMPKTKEEFECEMRRRKDEYGWDGGIRYYIAVDEKGSPLRERDKRAVCEIQKLALGGEKSWMECGPVEENDPTNPLKVFREYWPEVMHEKFVREVKIFFPTREERDGIEKLFGKLVHAEKEYTPKTGGSPDTGGGVSCAFPGGCE